MLSKYSRQLQLSSCTHPLPKEICHTRSPRRTPLKCSCSASTYLHIPGVSGPLLAVSSRAVCTRTGSKMNAAAKQGCALSGASSCTSRLQTELQGRTFRAHHGLLGSHQMEDAEMLP